VANIKSQEKRNRQNEKRRQRNSQVKSSVRTVSKKILKIMEAQKPEISSIESLLKEFSSTIDNAAGKGIIHKNTAARKKSRLAKRANAIKKSQAAQA
jgi:small subunit ribosomal protein S20